MVELCVWTIKSQIQQPSQSVCSVQSRADLDRLIVHQTVVHLDALR